MEHESDGEMASIQRLPPEVLLQIFPHICTDATFSIARPDYPTIVLSHVCHRWRAVVLNHKQLWTGVLRVIIDAECAVQEEEEGDTICVDARPFRRREALGHYLSHSGNLPLDVRFWDRMSPLGTPGARCAGELLCRSLARYFPRWRSCDIPWYLSKYLVVSVIQEQVYAEDTICIEATLLESLVITPDDPEETLIVSFITSPHLRRLVSPTQEQALVPWQQLTYIHFTSWLAVHKFVFFLRFCTSVQCLRASLSSEDHSDTPVVAWWLKKPARLPDLAQLHLTIDDSDVLAYFFRNIRAPAMAHLSLVGGEEDEDMTVIVVQPHESLVVRHMLECLAQSPVLHLELQYLLFPASLLTHLLKHLPSMTHLTILETENTYFEDDDDNEDGLVSNFSHQLLFALEGKDIGNVDDHLQYWVDHILPQLETLHVEGGVYDWVRKNVALRSEIQRVCDSRTAPSLHIEIDERFSPWMEGFEGPDCGFEERHQMTVEYGSGLAACLEEATGERMGMEVDDSSESEDDSSQTSL
ncbi:hypothetical protein BD626DRAFT_634454 [Schizophyllum amplum]|uniref:F-box domain-containing protein n=1 Tax=Schizophyllum amplum TaxID=97359 RepID=A0A550BZE8_9AGAR|nr:hypothetical protein BD626DRAFT_634454 [Auriculariopsis ampla]